MENTDCFVIDIQIPVCLGKYQPCNICKLVYLLTFHIYINDLPKIIDFKSH